MDADAHGFEEEAPRRMAAADPNSHSLIAFILNSAVEPQINRMNTEPEKLMNFIESP